MSTESSIPISVHRDIEVAPERVFDAWTDPVMAWSWLREAASIQPARGRTVRVEIDPQVGGAFTFVDLRDGAEVLHTGRYLELDRPRRLEFTWSIPALSTDEDVIRVDVTPAPGGCRVTLTTELRPEWAAYAAPTRQGWAVTLDAIAAVLLREESQAASATSAAS